MRKIVPSKTKINYASFHPIGCGLGVLQSPTKVIDTTNDDDSLHEDEMFPVNEFPLVLQIETFKGKFDVSSNHFYTSVANR